MALAGWLARQKRLWRVGLSAAAANARHNLLAGGKRLWALRLVVALLLAFVFESIILLLSDAPSLREGLVSAAPLLLIALLLQGALVAAASVPMMWRRRRAEAARSRRDAQLAQLIQDMQDLDELLGDPDEEEEDDDGDDELMDDEMMAALLDMRSLARPRRPRRRAPAAFSPRGRRPFL